MSANSERGRYVGRLNAGQAHRADGTHLSLIEDCVRNHCSAQGSGLARQIVMPVLNIFRAGDVLKIAGTWIIAPAILVIDLLAGRSRSKEGLSDKAMNGADYALAIHAGCDEGIADSHQGVLKDSLPSGLNTAQSLYATNVADFVNALKANGWFPDFHRTEFYQPLIAWSRN